MKNKPFISFITWIWVVIMLTSVVSAAGAEVVAPDSGKAASLSIRIVNSETDLVVADMDVEIHQVASAKIDEEGGVVYTWTEPFASLSADPNQDLPRTAIDAIGKIIEEAGINGTRGTTDERGEVLFPNLSHGIYYIRQIRKPGGELMFMPFLSYAPVFEDGAWVYEIKAEPKVITDSANRLPPSYTDVRVRKVWNDDGSSRPSEVTVELLCEDGVLGQVVLNQENGWSHTWKDLPEDKQWEVREVNVPEGYVVTYSRDGFAFTVTNTAKLAQTGQNRLPVPILLISGTLCVLAGAILLLRQGKKRET